MLITWTLGGVVFILLITVYILRKKVRRHARKALWHKNNRLVSSRHYLETIQQLQDQLKGEYKPPEWQLIGVILADLEIGGSSPVYGVVEFNPGTGAVRAAPPEQRFFTIHAENPQIWDTSGGRNIPLTQLSAPRWSQVLGSDRPVPDIVLCGQVYSFRYGAATPYYYEQDDHLPLITALQDTRQQELQLTAS